MMPLTGEREGEKEGPDILRYYTPWVAHSISWVRNDAAPFRLAVSSFIQDYKNYVQIVEKDENDRLVCRASWEHCYPATKTMFPPRPLGSDYIITTADYLRLWEVTPTAGGEQGDRAARPSGQRQGTSAEGPDSTSARSTTGDSSRYKVTLKQVFDNSKPNNYCSPVTSCDWNSEDPHLVGCCSIDSSVSMWDVERGEERTKIFAHDKDAYDLVFLTAHTFASCGADGSVRLFDLRNLDRCSILYETKTLTPILRVASNQLDRNFISMFGIDSNEAGVIDIRYPGGTASLLSGVHQQPINGMAWSPQWAQNICTVGEDGLACIWDAGSNPGEKRLEHACGTPINSVVWQQANQQDWIGITTSDGATLLRV